MISMYQMCVCVCVSVSINRFSEGVIATVCVCVFPSSFHTFLLQLPPLSYNCPIYIYNHLNWSCLSVSVSLCQQLIALVVLLCVK